MKVTLIIADSKADYMPLLSLMILLGKQNEGEAQECYPLRFLRIKNQIGFLKVTM